VLISGGTKKSETSQKIKMIVINIIPPNFGFTSLCNDLLFGISFILENKLKNKTVEVAKIVEIKQSNITTKNIELSKITI